MGPNINVLRLSLRLRVEGDFGDSSAAVCRTSLISLSSRSMNSIRLDIANGLRVAGRIDSTARTTIL